MKLRVVRDHFSPVATTGELYIDGVFECFTLEDPDRHLDQGGEKIYGCTAIPAGTYEVTITESQHFGNRRLPLLLGVPGYAGVRIHTGNGPDDTEGCILVGTSRSGSFVGNSRVAFSRLFPLLDEAVARGERVTLEVTRA